MNTEKWGFLPNVMVKPYAVRGVDGYRYSISEPVDIVNIFRAVEAIPGIVEEAIMMQLGLAHNESARKARPPGMLNHNADRDGFIDETSW